MFVNAKDVVSFWRRRMTEIEQTELIQLLSEDGIFIRLFLKDGRKSIKLPVEINVASDRLKVYYQHKLYMQLFYHMLHNIKYEYINFEMQLVKFVYQDQMIGLQIR